MFNIGGHYTYIFTGMMIREDLPWSPDAEMPLDSYSVFCGEELPFEHPYVLVIDVMHEGKEYKMPLIAKLNGKQLSMFMKDLPKGEQEYFASEDEKIAILNYLININI